MKSKQFIFVNSDRIIKLESTETPRKCPEIDHLFGTPAYAKIVNRQSCQGTGARDLNIMTAISWTRPASRVGTTSTTSMVGKPHLK
jgi:hypothetical protein